MGLNFLLYFGYEKMVSYLVANNFTSAMSRFARLSEMTTLLYESKVGKQTITQIHISQG